MMAGMQTNLSHADADTPLGQQHRLMLGASLKSNSTKSYTSYQKRSEWSERSSYSIFPKLPNLIFLCRKLLQHKAFFSGHLQQQN